MVLVVITHVERQRVDWAVITVGLLLWIVRVMFLNPTGAYRVQPDGEEKRKGEIQESRPATEINRAHIVGDSAGKVYEEPSVPHGDCFQTRRPRQLEKRKEHQPDRFTIPFVADQARLPMVGQVGIVFVIALMRMMAQMINAETHRARIQIRKIGQDADQLVPALISKNEIMSGVVDDDVIDMVSERADTVSDHQAEPPVTEAEFAKPKG